MKGFYRSFQREDNNDYSHPSNHQTQSQPILMPPKYSLQQRQIQILPGSYLKSDTIPLEPPEPPPPPTTLLKFLVVGNSQSMKQSILQHFLYPSAPSDSFNLENDKRSTHEYYKKDITLSHSSSNNHHDICIRLQLWNIAEHTQPQISSPKIQGIFENVSAILLCHEISPLDNHPMMQLTQTLPSKLSYIYSIMSGQPTPIFLLLSLPSKSETCSSFLSSNPDWIDFGKNLDRYCLSLFQIQEWFVFSNHLNLEDDYGHHSSSQYHSISNIMMTVVRWILNKDQSMRQTSRKKNSSLST